MTSEAGAGTRTRDTTRPQRADAQRNREKLLVTAAKAFAESGTEVPLETIAAQAGVGVGTLYRHFPSRSSLVEAAYRHEVEQVCAAADLLVESQPSDVALSEWMERFVDYAATKRGMGQALRSALASDSPLFADTRSRMVDALHTLLTRAVADGTVRADVDAEDVMRAMSGVWLVAEGPEWKDQARRLLDLLMDGLRYGARGPAKG